MTMECVASHYSGCGNDFLLFDNRSNSLSEFSPVLIQSLCSVAGVDGLIVVKSSKCADAAMMFYNCDGNEAEMCGNGVRCLMQFLRQKLAYPRVRCLLQTKQREMVISCDGPEIVVNMGKVHELAWGIQLTHNKKKYRMHYLDSGVPHLVIFVDNVESIDVERVGSYFRNHARFQPKGTNVNFVSHEGNIAHIRTFERGVENETLACGTGVCASAYALYKVHGVTSPISFQVRSKEWLHVLFEPKDGVIDNLVLKGPATWIRDCKVTLDFAKSSCSLQFSYA